MSLKSIVRKYKLKGANQKRSEAPYKGFDQIRTVGICYESKEHDMVNKYANELIKKGKSVQLLQYVPLKKKEIEKQQLTFKTGWFCKSDANWLDIPKNDHLNTFFSKTYDIYMELADGNNPLVEYISISNKSLFKIGKSSKSHSTFDLVINQNQTTDLESVFKEIDYYLNFINQES